MFVRGLDEERKRYLGGERERERRRDEVEVEGREIVVKGGLLELAVARQRLGAGKRGSGKGSEEREINPLATCQVHWPL